MTRGTVVELSPATNRLPRPGAPTRPVPSVRIPVAPQRPSFGGGGGKLYSIGGKGPATPAAAGGAAPRGSGGATLRMDTRGFNSTLAELQKRNGKSGPSVVRYWTRKLVQKAAYSTPIGPRGKSARGRLRAGWWPAALMCGQASVYTDHPNAGEGAGIDGTADPVRPQMTIENSVPYIGFLRDGIDFFEDARDAVEEKMQKELEEEYGRNVFAAWGGG